MAAALAVEPTAQPTGLNFVNVKAYTLSLNFTTTVANGYLILKSDQPITDVPVDGTTYEKGQGLTSCKVMYVGVNNIHSVKHEVQEGTTYYFKIFAYNGTGNQINYLQTNPLSGTVATPAMDAGNYYSAIDSSSGNFIADLHALINAHTWITYTSYKTNIVPDFFERDTTGAQVVINCEYSNETTIYTAPFDFVAQAYNREHVLCKSWMQTAALYGASNLVYYVEGSDFYNLLLVRSTPNQIRSNNPLGIVLNVTMAYGESKYGTDNTGNNVFEPKENRKGDAARNMMYEMVCYDGLSGGWGLNELLSLAYKQDQNILKLWNQQDPPDKFERTKNEYINSLQHNRNPFIDHPNWANCINFDSLIKTNLCGAVSGIQDEVLNVGLRVYPNPVSEVLNVELMSAEFEYAEISMYDIYGREMMKPTFSNQHSTFSIAELASGNYVLKISMNGQSAFRKVLILH